MVIQLAKSFVLSKIRSYQTRSIQLLVLAMTTLPVYGSDNIHLTDNIQKSGFIDSQQEKKLAYSILRQLNQSNKIIDDPWLVDSFKQLISTINVKARSNALVASVILDDSQINAFATPGGVIAVNSGLILRADRVDELVGVLAHEVAHISQRHFSRRNQTLGKDILVQLGGIVTSAVLANKNPELASAVATGSQAYVMDKRLAFSRTQEKEADSIGIQIMQEAGFDASGMAGFFIKLGKNNNLKGRVPEFLSTHPLTQNRLSEAVLRSQHSNFKPSKQYQLAQQQFYLMKWRVIALSGAMDISDIAKVANSDDAEATGAKFALAHRYLRVGDKKRVAKAQVVLNSIDKKLIEHPLYFLIQADIFNRGNQYTKAKKTLENAVSLYPENRALALKYADVLRIQGQANKALDVLKPFVRLQSDISTDVVMWQALADTAKELPKNDLNQLIALRFQAEALFWKNQLEPALRSLARAETLAEKYPSHQAKINKRYLQMLAVYQKK